MSILIMIKPHTPTYTITPTASQNSGRQWCWDDGPQQQRHFLNGVGTGWEGPPTTTNIPLTTRNLSNVKLMQIPPKSAARLVLHTCDMCAIACNDILWVCHFPIHYQHPVSNTYSFTSQSQKRVLRNFERSDQKQLYLWVFDVVLTKQIPLTLVPHPPDKSARYHGPSYFIIASTRERHG